MFCFALISKAHKVCLKDEVKNPKNDENLLADQVELFPNTKKVKAKTLLLGEPRKNIAFTCNFDQPKENDEG
jgi:hypothetical protein